MPVLRPDRLAFDVGTFDVGTFDVGAFDVGTLDACAVVRAQGADPEVLCHRRPAAYEAAVQAAADGAGLLAPAACYGRRRIAALRHEHVVLAGGDRLSGPLVARELGGALDVVGVVCTVGAALEGRVSAAFDDDPVYAAALDAYGSLAVEALGRAVCAQLAAAAAAEGLYATRLLSPGLVGWPVAAGQRTLFELVDARRIGVALGPHALMTPRKSLSFVVGRGTSPTPQGEPCDFCAVRETCRHPVRAGVLSS